MAHLLFCTLQLLLLTTASQIEAYSYDKKVILHLSHDGMPRFYSSLFFGSDNQGSATGKFIIDTTSSYTVVSSTYSSSLDCSN